MSEVTKEPAAGKADTKPDGRFRVHFMPHEKEVLVEKGANLLDAAQNAGVYLNASCGGKGVCGGCKVRVNAGNVKTRYSPKITDMEERHGIRQACLCSVESDLEIFVPKRSRADAGALPDDEGVAARHSVDFAPELRPPWRLDPPVKRLYIEAVPPAPNDNINDLTRVMRALKTSHGIEDAAVDFRVLKTLPREARKDNWKLTLTLNSLRRDAPGGDLEGYAQRRPRIVHMEGSNTAEKHYAIAVDIGTTTVAVELLDVHEGKVLARRSEYNAQISRGEDVISRILYAEKEGGLKELQNLVAGTINSLIDKLLNDTGVERKYVFGMSAAGNTTMTHIFLDLDVRHIRRSPYTPVMFMAPQVPANELGLNLEEYVRVYTFPMVASYVGGDIVSGVVSNGMYLRPELTLYMDIGTNGEIVLGNKEWLLTASASAGSAFEGGGIEYGMRATIGAIDSVMIDHFTAKPDYDTIGKMPPRGICGSGIIDLAAELMVAGILGPDGKFDTSRHCPRLRETEGLTEYVVEYADNTGIGEDIVFTEMDVDNLMRAKAAMYAGYNTLLESVNMDVSDLDRVLIAGGFGRGLKFKNAIALGLLPDIDPSRIRYVGNGSLIGARLICFSEALMSDAERVGAMMTNFELSETPKFMEHYVAALFLPHTEIERFPSVVKRKEKASYAGDKSDAVSTWHGQ